MKGDDTSSSPPHRGEQQVACVQLRHDAARAPYVGGEGPSRLQCHLSREQRRSHSLVYMDWDEAQYIFQGREGTRIHGCHGEDYLFLRTLSLRGLGTAWY